MRSENYVCVQITDVNMATQGDDNKVVCSTNVNKELERNLITVYKKFDVILNNKNESFTKQSESIVEVWHCLTKCKFEKSDLDYAIQIMDWAKLNTLNIVLAGEWKKYKSQYQDALLKEVKATQNQLKKIHSMFDTRCQKLLIVINNPWSDPTLEYLVRTPNAEIGPKEIDFFCVETAYLIAVRLKKLCESQCEDLALNLVKAFMKCYRQQQVGNFNLNATETQVWFIFDMHVALLYKFKENDSLLEMLKGVSAEEGLNIITRFANKRVEISKIWKHCHRIAILAAKVYISSTILKPIDEIQGILRELLRVYVLLNNSEEFLKDVVESVRSIIRLAETAAHIYIFCDVFQEQLETKMKTFIIELYIRALTTDMNLLERQKSDNEKDKLVETTRRLANGFTNLAEVLKGDVNVSRECILTAFSLQPTTDRMRKIEELAKVSGLEVLDTGQEWKCKLHPPILPSDDLAWICSSCGEYMCKPQLNVPLNTNIALNEALTEEKLGITRELCDDLVVLLSCPRYQVFSWLLDWPDLQRLCVMYLNDPERTKNFVTELKFLDIDYSMFANIKKEPLDEYAGIERGYEHYLDHEFNSDDDQISCASEDTASQESKFFNLSCDSTSEIFCLPGVPKKSDPNTLKSLRLFRPSLKRSRNNAESTVVPEKVLKSDLADLAIPCSSKQTELTPPIVNSSKQSNSVTLEIDSADISNQYFLPIQGYTKGNLNSFSSLEPRSTVAPVIKPLFSSQNIAQPIKTYANQFNHNNHLDSTYYKAYPGKSATTITNQTAAPQLNCDMSRVPSVGNSKNGQVATLQQVGGQVAVQKSPTKMPMDSGLILGSHNTSNNSKYPQPQMADTTSRQTRDSPQELTILCQNKQPSLAVAKLLDSPSSVVTLKMDVENTICRNARDTDKFRYFNSKALESISRSMHQDNQDISNRLESSIGDPTNNSSPRNICEKSIIDISTDVVKSDCDLPSISDRRNEFRNGVPNLFEDFEPEEYLEPMPSEYQHTKIVELEETRHERPNLKSYSKKKKSRENNFVETRTKTKTAIPQFCCKKNDDKLNISLEDNHAGYADTLLSSESEYDCFSDTNPILQNVLSKIDSFEKEMVIASSDGYSEKLFTQSVDENKPGPSNYKDECKSVATKIKSKGKRSTIAPSDRYSEEAEGNKPGPSNYKGKGKSIAKGKGCIKKSGKSRSRREPKYESYPDSGSDSQFDVDSDDQFNRCYIELFKNNLLYDTIEGVCKNIDFYLKSKNKITSSDLPPNKGKKLKKSIPSKKNKKSKTKITSEKTVLDVGSKSKPKSDIPIRDIRVIINRIPEVILRSLNPVQNDFPVLDMVVLDSTQSESPQSIKENSNVLHDTDKKINRSPEVIITNSEHNDNVSPMSVITIDNRNQDLTRWNGHSDVDGENNGLPEVTIRTSEHSDNDSPVSIVTIDDNHEKLTISNKVRSNGFRDASKENKRFPEVTMRTSEYSDNDSPVSVVVLRDSDDDSPRSKKEKAKGSRYKENNRLPEVMIRCSDICIDDSPVSVAGIDITDKGSPKLNTEETYGPRDADKENNNLLPEVLVRNFRRSDSDTPMSVVVIDDTENYSPRSNKKKENTYNCSSRSNKEKENCTCRCSEKNTRISEVSFRTSKDIDNDSLMSARLIEDTDNGSQRSNKEQENDYCYDSEEDDRLFELLVRKSKPIDNGHPMSVRGIDDKDNSSPRSNKEKENYRRNDTEENRLSEVLVRSSRRIANDSPLSVVVIEDKDNSSPRSNKEKENDSCNDSEENNRLSEILVRSSRRIANDSPMSVVVIDDKNNDSPRSNKEKENGRCSDSEENNRLSEILGRSCRRVANDSPISVVVIDDKDNSSPRSNKEKESDRRNDSEENNRLSEILGRSSRRIDNDSPMSVVVIDDKDNYSPRSNKEKENDRCNDSEENNRLSEILGRSSRRIANDSPISVVVIDDKDNDSPRSYKENESDRCNDSEENNRLSEIFVRSSRRIDNDSPMSVVVIDDKNNDSPRSNKEKENGRCNGSEENNRLSETLVRSSRRIDNDSPMSVVVIDDTDIGPPRSNKEKSDGLRNVNEEDGLSEILVRSSRLIDNDSPMSIVVIDDTDNGPPVSNKEKANVALNDTEENNRLSEVSVGSSRRINDSPASVVVIGDSDNESPRSKKEQANGSRNAFRWKEKTIKISDADKENSGLPVAFMRSSGRIAIYTPASEIVVLDESDTESPRSNKGSPNGHRGTDKESSSSLNTSLTLSSESTKSKEDRNVHNSACDMNSADGYSRSDQNKYFRGSAKTTCNKNDILCGNFPNVRNNNTKTRTDDSKDGNVEVENPKVSVERLSVNDNSYVRSVLANIPGLHDTELMRPTNTNMVVNVVQIAGGRNNASVPVASAQTSTQVTPHIQRIGQPRFEKPQNDQPDNGNPIVTSVATSVSNSVKPSTSQPSTLINILSQQVIRPGQSNYARTRPSPLINIVSHQIIRPSTQVVPKMTTASAQTNEQVNDAPKPETPTEQPASTIVTSAVKSIATTVKTAGSVASSPAPGTILQFICKSATLPKFQQAFGKTVYHTNNVETTDATSSGENSNSSSDTNKKTPVKGSTVNIQPLQGSVIYTRQVPVGQAINLIPPGRQVFRIATSNPDQISLVKDSVIHSKMSALLTAALQGKKTTEVVEGDGNDNVERVTVTRPTLVQSARIVKPVIQIPSNVIRANTNTQSNLSSTTLEQLREFDMVYKQIKERSNTGTTPSESSTQSESENPPHGISVTYLNQGQKFTQLSPVVVVSSYCNLQPAASPALSVTSQGSSSPCVTPAPTPTLPKVSSKTSSKGKSLKNASTHISKSSPVPKPQQKPQEDEHTTQRIFDILAEYAEQLRNSPDLNNKPAPRRRSNPPTNPNHNSKRKKSSGSKKPSTTGSAISESDLEDQRTIGSEDSSCGIVQLSVKDEEQVQNQRTESNDSTTSTRPLILTETNSNSTTRNLIIADSSVGEALKLQNTAVLVPGNYIMPVSMVKGGQQIAVVSGGSKILATVPARSGPNMLLFQSFLNQNRKPGVPTVKYSTLQPISGISSQNLAGVSGQSSVILPQTTHNLTAVTLGQPLTLKKMEDSDNRVNTELLLAIAQPRESANATENSTLPDSSTSIQNSNSIKLDGNYVRINNSSDKIYTYQKSPVTAPIATPVISQTAQVENGSEDNSTSVQPSIITLNIAADNNKDGASRTAKRVQSVLVAACTSSGPMLSHTPPRYRKASESTPINSEMNLKGVYLHNGEKQKEETKHFQTTAVYFPTKTKKSVSHPAKLDRELHQLCLQRKQAAIERELRLQKSLSEECEDLGVDEPSTSDLFPEADLLFDSNHSPSFDQTSQDVVRKAMHPDKDKSIMLFSDDDNSSSLRTDFLFDSVQYQTEGELQYEQSRQLTNGQSSTSNESGSSCEDNTLLQNCASMSDVTLNSPISPEFTDNPTHMNKYKFKYSNRKKAERHKQVETWTASGEVSSSEDTMCSELGKIVHSPKGCVIKRGSHSSSCDEDEEFKVVRIAISKTDLAKDDESCEELHYDDDLDSPSSGRGARRSVKKMCSCCNGAQEGNRKRPSSRPHTPALHKKAFLNKKR